MTESPLYLMGAVLAASAGILAMVVARRVRRRRRRAALLRRPFPERWRRILDRTMPLYRSLPPVLRDRLHGHVHVFLAEKEFEGCGGLTVTDEMRVTIAAHACMLFLNRKATYYPSLSSILVYPGAYAAQEKTAIGDLPFVTTDVRLGESWTRGAVVLAWDPDRRGTRDVRARQNLIFHEFAHQLDQEDGVPDGAPSLEGRAGYTTWARVLGREYARLRRSLGREARPVLDEYGATDPAEFFAVATEAFFDTPRKLRRKHPALYRVLSGYFRLDPAAWR
jgi:Mlc titration factor MtfA (ptsG expression regulator)